MASPGRFYHDLIVQDHHRTDGSSLTLAFDWGRFNGSFHHGRAKGWGIQYIRRRGLPGALPTEEVAIYRGEWKEGKRDGHGRLEIPWEGKVLEGGWLDGKAFGWGRTQSMSLEGWCEGWSESGYKEGMKHGWGVELSTKEETSWGAGGFKDGEKYGYWMEKIGIREVTASYKHGKLHGYKIVKDRGVLFSREFFENGVSVGRLPSTSVAKDSLPSILFFEAMGAAYPGRNHATHESAISANGDSFVGNLNYGTPHGYGTLTYSNLHSRRGTYEGGFKHGFACGYGVWMGAEGFVYAGGWLNGRPFGFGKITSGGATFEVFWEETGAGWRFEAPWLSPPVFQFRAASPAPLPPQWNL
jgi:MORN repeat